MATLNAMKLWPTVAIAPSPSLIVLLKVSPSLSSHFQPDHNQNSYHLGRVLSESAMGKITTVCSFDYYFFFFFPFLSMFCMN